MILVRRLTINFVAFLVLVINTSCNHAVSVSSAPGFPGGKAELERFLSENMRWKQSQVTIEGTVFVSFVVNSRGKIGNVRVTKSLCESCDTEAVRIVNSMPNWIPAKKNGKPIGAEAIISIPFKLSGN
jgi:protein TonB